MHLQFSGCGWNAFPVMCYVAFTTVVFVGNLARTCYRTFTTTPMIAICKVNERKNKAFGRGNFLKKAAHSDICINTVLIDNKEF